ncbi:MAG: hypothetical protein C5B54_03155 [Acidobacteria bacterium]|nr:MAG: hypothetical protein C5B54_03155 [Acidobacteriota bacterium]
MAAPDPLKIPPGQTTGDAPLSPQASLSYNGIAFSMLYKSVVNGAVVQDEAKRTTRFMEYTLIVDGLVTLHEDEDDTDVTWRAIRKQLTAHAGALRYEGNGFGTLNVNMPGGTVWDVAFGPVPKMIYFQPLGQGRSALIKWEITTRIPEINIKTSQDIHGQGPVVQFNWSATLTYDDEGYSGWDLHGTLEIALTRPRASERTLDDIVDAFRSKWLDIRFDLTKFRVVKRVFNYSRDKRTCEWEYSVEELPPMGLPMYCTKAGGDYSVSSMGDVFTGVQWNCSLRATYTVAKTWPSRIAMQVFYALLWYKMQMSANGDLPRLNNANNDPQQKAQPNVADDKKPPVLTAFLTGLAGQVWPELNLRRIYTEIAKNKPQATKPTCVLTSFGFREGIYLDSKHIEFEASWWLTTTLRNLIVSTGVWRWTPDIGGGTWAQSMRDMQGWASWMKNLMNKDIDVIVDMGGGDPSKKFIDPDPGQPFFPPAAF